MHERPLIEAGLRSALPARLHAGRPTALFVHGWAFAPGGRIVALELLAGGRSHRPMAFSMPSPRLAAELGADPRDSAQAFFWGPVPLSGAGGPIELGLRARVASGGEAAADLGTIATPASAGAPAPPDRGEAGIAICMATHEPPPELLARQLASLRAQTRTDWVCVISDDASGPERFGELERLAAEDPRFVISRSGERLGAYENFHRALAMAPRDVQYVALCDQDDEWMPHKLATLVERIGSAQLVFSDMRIVAASGREQLAPTYWTHRRPNHENFASLLLGNSVTGAASLFPRELLDAALPLPPRFGNLYHDHWLALVARARGEIAYVDEPLYDYVQHDDAVVGHARANRGVAGGGLLRRVGALRAREPGRLRGSWREIYFGEYCRMRLSAAALRVRLGDSIDPEAARALSRVEAGGRAAPWLALRQLRRLRRDETQGSEAAMLRALAWERLMHRARGGRLDDADLPAGLPGARS